MISKRKVRTGGHTARVARLSGSLAPRANAWPDIVLTDDEAIALATSKDDEATIQAARKRLKGSVVKYERPSDPVIDSDS